MLEVYQGIRLDNGQYIEGFNCLHTADGRVFIMPMDTEFTASGRDEHTIHKVTAGNNALFVEVGRRTVERIDV